ncbi:glutamate--tRNA ligase [Carbonactinospora thermoautotrophica]|uniref:Glutamate--tRNA ligase n=1 Tax=Carbonactinospora thermoautotrophica TaxID=1469144 RepID=A0A132MPB3_9ACTN|nr:glutamate--tRNA ligase [Carbonactinospora thermoautotrophica]KWW99623.1 Glutamyl-tRNA synthetase [Carbonactinospora thermoautotrophica]KWX04000.1 glutamyl-tRNA synthetase [Carbonactinospora thermoautotrophica]KWX09816.1 glutamyl-tRNA synthetase [Carbonactinospora thermoautotrophica]MCX9191810.1 glutamate--tRNA ligase [Carbonactinospora thermoautotrophica]
MTDAASADVSRRVRVRFCPSPTGNPHVGIIRTALFNWAFARHHGGVFVFRIEDTDAARDSEESYQALLDAMRWLGLDWDEGPEVGGPYGPYRQSQRMEIYAEVSRKLLEGGYAYHCYCTPEELEERRERARAEGRPPGYDGHCRELTDEQVARYRAEGREPVVRFRMPDRTITFTDLVRGEVTFEAEHVPDYVLVRANGHPLYTLVNPVDDALMRITHVLRGEDLLSSTPRQIALYEALAAIGVSDGTLPEFGHLPYVMGEGNRKLSKRDPESSLNLYRERGFLPEGLLNYLALLGWSIGDDRELFTLAEMVEKFDISRVNPNPARFDMKKCEAINAARLRQLDTEDLARRIVPYLQGAGVLGKEITPEQEKTLIAAVPLVQERMVVLSDAVGMLGFLFLDEDRFAVDEQDAAKVLTPDARPALEAAHKALTGLDAWTKDAIEGVLREALVEGLGLKPKHAFTPVRVAVTGRRVSPPLFESLELLGRDRTLGRIRRALDSIDG